MLNYIMAKKVSLFYTIHGTIDVIFKKESPFVVFPRITKEKLITVRLSNRQKKDIRFEYNGISSSLMLDDHSIPKYIFIPYESIVRLTNKNYTSELDIIALKINLDKKIRR